MRAKSKLEVRIRNEACVCSDARVCRNYVQINFALHMINK